jgi:hypothetical protein
MVFFIAKKGQNFYSYTEDLKREAVHLRLEEITMILSRGNGPKEIILNWY